MNPPVSVVVPVYNGERLLAKCLHSITAQTLRDIEIICVDDASTDGTPAILRALAQEDARIRILTHATNQGVGPARNTGVRAARGDYIASVDNDDFIDADMLATLHATALEGDFDVVCCGARVIDEAGRVIDTWIRPDATVIVADRHRDLFDLMDPTVWNKLWRRSIYTDHDIWFAGQTRHDDLGWTYRALMQARRIRTLGHAYYNYLLRPDSLSHGFDIAHLVDHVVTFERMREAMIAADLVRDNAASFARAVHGALSHHAHKARDAGPPGEETLRHLRCVLAIKRAYLAPGRPEEALMDAAQIATAIDLPPEVDRDIVLRERDAALRDREAAIRDRDAARAEAGRDIAARDAEIGRMKAHLRDLAALPRGPRAPLRALAALRIMVGQLTGRRRMVRRGARLRIALRRLGMGG
ncbi:glycosyltransferase [Roseomonas sp. CAU 1739]|uniref:glycosyltransferase n=1 Tax=Roseomonas sp. CAU 1739 TaxID=3140364 RepID=UPI00325B948A